MQIKPISLNEWLRNEKGNPIGLAILPYSVSEVEEISGLHFEEYVEDGLGTCFSRFVELEGQDAHLKGCVDRDSRQIGVVVEMHTQEKHPMRLLEKLCGFFGLDLSQLNCIGEHTGHPRYVVYRVDDNGNEIEMERFHLEVMATWYADTFAKKGHKQAYFIRHAT